jgi:hypothetical protein
LRRSAGSDRPGLGLVCLICWLISASCIPFIQFTAPCCIFFGVDALSMDARSKLSNVVTSVDNGCSWSLLSVAFEIGLS